jgi:hypothetical protein
MLVDFCPQFPPVFHSQLIFSVLFEGKKVKYVFANTTAQRENKLNPRANTPAVVNMHEINPRYENTPAINQSKSRILI